MSTLTMLKGLPASGKTTWAKQQNAKRVNKDDLRSMLDDGQWSNKNEKLVLEVRDELVCYLLGGGYDVIVDDTNLAPKHEPRLRELADQCGAEFAIKDFTDVSVDECIKRDQARPNYVGEKVIRSMYNQFLKDKTVNDTPKTLPYNYDLPNCIIVDIDGTLAHMTGRSPYDYTRVSEDVVDESVAQIVRKYSQRDPMTEIPDTYIIVVSGRKDDCAVETKQWLLNNQIPYDELHMRKSADNREDSIIKREIYDEWIKNRYNVRFVLDDRDRVVKMWRELGLKVLQVGEGAF